MSLYQILCHPEFTSISAGVLFGFMKTRKATLPSLAMVRRYNYTSIMPVGPEARHTGSSLFRGKARACRMHEEDTLFGIDRHTLGYDADAPELGPVITINGAIAIPVK